MRVAHTRRWPALLMVAVASACTTLAPEAGIEPVPRSPAAFEAGAAIPPAPLAAASPQEQNAPPESVVASADERWAFQLKPYFVACGMKGSVGTGRSAMDIDADFDDLFDSLNIGGMFAFEADLPDSSWTLLTDLMYVQLEDEGLSRGPVGVAVSAKIDQFIGELSAAYEVVDDGQLEIVGGARYWYMSAELEANLPRPRSAEGTEDWIDPLVGLRSRLALGSHFDLFLRGDMGGFGAGSELAYNLSAELGWNLSETFQAALGYRLLDVDYQDEVTYDMTLAGPTLGLAIRF